jgi:hypothetical protein
MASMVGVNPIEYYYPNRDFGELNIVPQNLLLQNSDPTPTPIMWVRPAILNKLRGDRSPITPIYEQLRFLDEGEAESCAITVFLKAAWARRVSGLIFSSGGDIKYAIVGGRFPPSLTLNIDTGRIYGRMNDLDEILAEEFGDIPSDIPEDNSALEAASVFGFDYGTQSPRRFTESNYGTFGSARAHAKGFGRSSDVTFTARAFDASAPTERYIDGRFVFEVQSNWSSDRDGFILNIRNQFFVDGKPVTNEKYLSTMKARGYFRDTCPRRKR